MRVDVINRVPVHFKPDAGCVRCASTSVLSCGWGANDTRYQGLVYNLRDGRGHSWVCSL
ncbi:MULTISPECIES: hypothetical protein [Morganellaceae]|uniref:hypothetical protein n=1 Tax=Morganellaceae TaxID=1903414 RepID=UPI0013A5A654|nr:MULTISPECIES: hypothetical protein [Providencia]ELR5204397.1 hypothetical protein [Providencia rettgeri]